MSEPDLFNFFRWALFIFVSIYCTLITVQSLWSWYVWLATNDRYIAILRRYVIVHGLRLRFGTFWGDVLICGLLCIVFVLMMWAHAIIRSMNDVLI
jgi:hypothetical protein